MSPRREDISNAIWSDPDFEDLSLDATTLYLWSFTNPRCGMAGIYKVSRRAMTESKVPLDRLDAALAELAQAGFAFYESGVLWVRTRVKHLRTQTPQIAKSAANDVNQIAADHPLRVRFLAEYGDLPWLREAFKPFRTDPHPTVNRGSVEGHETALDKGTSVTLTCPSPEGHPTLKGKGRVREEEQNGAVAPAREAADVPPADFPAELRPALAKVQPILERVAADKGATAVKTAAVARAIASFPRRDHFKAAGDMEQWLLYGTGQNRPVKDVVATFRNQLDRLPDLQGKALTASRRSMDDENVRRRVLGG